VAPTFFLQLSLNYSNVPAMNETALRVEANGDCQQPFMCPLSHVRAGTSVRIKQLATTPEVTHRLREMGFCEEQKIRLLAQQANVICQVCNVRLGISTQLAEKIIVEPIHPMPAQQALSRARQAA
jgi:Fe2+ transport system protein FeoA